MRWAEWNGRLPRRRAQLLARRPGTRGALATRLAGSSDLYQSERPQPLSQHQLRHLARRLHAQRPRHLRVEKHNEANGEGNRDGDNNNHSANYGIEGPTDNPDIERIRKRQIRNMMTSLMLSQGVPMINAGDEIRRTQQGNNNAYCQDNEISWFDWSLAEKNKHLFRFTSVLALFRQNEPAVRRREFLRGDPRRPGELPEVSWFGVSGAVVDWNQDRRQLACLFAARPEEIQEEDAHHVLILINAADRPVDFKLPSHVRAIDWRLFIDTGAESPYDAYPKLDGPGMPESGVLSVADRCTLVYVSDGSASAAWVAAAKARRVNAKRSVTNGKK